MTTKNLTKELYFSKNDATSVREVHALFEKLLATTWVINIYRNQEPKEINLKDLGWRISYNNAKKAAGTCMWKMRNVGFGIQEAYAKEVQLSMHFLQQNLGEGKAFEWEEVIRHELAHAVDFELRKKSNHDRHWVAVANAMLSTGERTFTDNQIGDEKPSKYTLVCGSCGKESKKHRRPTRESACGKCCREHNGGRFSKEFVLDVIQNY